jgi:hypothetical protein
MQCFDERKLRQYLEGKLSADEMIAACEHVRSCATCKSKVMESRAFNSAAFSIGQSATNTCQCPDYDDLSSYVDNVLAHESHQKIERHLNVCELCWSDVEALQAARSRASLAPPITVQPGMFTPKKSWLSFTWPKVAAIATPVAAALVITLALTQPHGVKPVKVASTEPSRHAPALKNPVIDANTGKQPAKVDEPPVKPVFVAELHDSAVSVGRTDGKLTIRTDGRDIEKQLAALVKAKLRNGSVPASFQMAKADDVRGPETLSAIKKLSPSPDALVGSRPVFRWEAVDGASKYSIEICRFDGTTALYAETESPNYQPDRLHKIPAGGYKWMVRARRGLSGEWQWSKAETFRILSAKETNLIASARRNYPGSHLMLGTVYESLGLNDSAVKEFRALAAENPRSKTAKKLLHGAESKL